MLHEHTYTHTHRHAGAHILSPHPPSQLSLTIVSPFTQQSLTGDLLSIRLSPPTETRDLWAEYRQALGEVVWDELSFSADKWKQQLERQSLDMRQVCAHLAHLAHLSWPGGNGYVYVTRFAFFGIPEQYEGRGTVLCLRIEREGELIKETYHMYTSKKLEAGTFSRVPEYLTATTPTLLRTA